MNATRHAPNITHEADAQRQHVRVPIPAKIAISGKEYDLKDWSVAGACIKTQDKTLFKEGSRHDAVLMFAMQEFALQVPMEVTVKNADTTDGVGIRYLNLNQRQVSLMQQLVGSYVNGEITSAGDLIHVVARNNFTKPRSMPKKGKASAAETINIFIRKLVLATVSIALLGFLAFSIYERNFIVTAENAYINAESFSIDAPSSGRLYFNNIKRGEKIAKGQTIMSIQSKTNEIKSIDSPCDCIVNQRLAKNGTTVEKGEALLALAPQGSDIFIDAFIEYDEATNIREGQNADISLYGADMHVNGVIEDISSVSIGKSKYEVRIRVDGNIPETLVGTAAKVSIDTLGLVH